MHAQGTLVVPPIGDVHHLATDNVEHFTVLHQSYPSGAGYPAWGMVPPPPPFVRWSLQLLAIPTGYQQQPRFHMAWKCAVLGPIDVSTFAPPHPRVGVMDLKSAQRLLMARDRAQRKHQAKRRAALSLGHAVHDAVSDYILRLEKISMEFGSGDA
jgi:hypothetical protein